MTDVASDFSGPAVLERVGTWFRRPITGAPGSPAEYIGSTYERLAQEPVGRHYLAKRGYVDSPHDLFARAALALVPHDAGCPCSACDLTYARGEERAPDRRSAAMEAEIRSVAQWTEQGASIPQAAGSTPAAPTSDEGVAQRTEQGDPTAQVAGSTPAAPTTPGVATEKPKRAKRAETGIEQKPGGGTVVKPKKPPKKSAEVARAEANLSMAKVMEDVERPLARLFEQAIEEEDRTFIGEAAEAGAQLAADSVAPQREDRIKRLSDRVVVDNGWAASWSARTVLEHRDRVEAAKREAQAIVYRAERDLEYHERVLLPKLKEYVEEYVEKTPVEQRASEKSVRPPGWPGRITLVDREERFDVQSPSLVLTQAIQKLGEDTVISLGLARVKLELRVDDFKEYATKNKAWASGLSGVVLKPKGSDVSLYRK